MNTEEELDLDEAASLLNVSSSHLSKLLDEGVLPSRGEGPQRQVLRSDLLAYREEWHAKRHAALNELQELSQELEMGY